VVFDRQGWFQRLQDRLKTAAVPGRGRLLRKLMNNCETDISIRGDGEKVFSRKLRIMIFLRVIQTRRIGAK
jgi:hypothetical protein